MSCPLAEPRRRFLVRVMSATSRVALQHGEELAAETQLGKSWEQGLTWAPTSVPIGTGLFLHDIAKLLREESDEDLLPNGEAVPEAEK